MNFKIEKSIPIPVSKPRGRKPKYPFGEMKVGDSFQMPLKTGKVALNSAQAYGVRNNMKFVSQQVGKMLRIWRSK